MRYIKLFENHYNKRTLVDLDLIEIENMVLDRIDKGDIDIKDFLTINSFTMNDIYLLNPYYRYRVFGGSILYPLFYPDELGSKYKTNNCVFNNILGQSVKLIRVELKATVGNRSNLDITGYTRDMMNSIFKRIPREFNVSSYIAILDTHISGPIVSESIIIFK